MRSGLLEQNFLYNLDVAALGSIINTILWALSLRLGFS